MYKMDRIEIQRGRLADGMLLTDQEKPLVDLISGSVLDVHGGVGLISEYLSVRGCTVTLLEDDHLAYSYRKNLCKNSKVKTMRININDLKLETPVYDYVIIRDWGHLAMAKKVAKVGVLNLLELKIEKVNENNPVNITEIKREDPKDIGVVEFDEESESSDLHSGEIE